MDNQPNKASWISSDSFKSFQAGLKYAYYNNTDKWHDTNSLEEENKINQLESMKFVNALQIQDGALAASPKNVKPGDIFQLNQGFRVEEVQDDVLVLSELLNPAAVIQVPFTYVKKHMRSLKGGQSQSVHTSDRTGFLYSLIGQFVKIHYRVKPKNHITDMADKLFAMTKSGDTRFVPSNERLDAFVDILQASDEEGWHALVGRVNNVGSNYVTLHALVEDEGKKPEVQSLEIAIEDISHINTLGRKFLFSIYNSEAPKELKDLPKEESKEEKEEEIVVEKKAYTRKSSKKKIVKEAPKSSADTEDNLPVDKYVDDEEDFEEIF